MHMQAVRPVLLELFNSGQAVLPPLVFPDNDGANAAMCRFLAWQMLRMDDAPTPDQVVKQAEVTITHFQPQYQDNFVYDNLGNISAPTLVLVGSQEIILPLGDSQVLADKIPGASLIRFPDAGHAAIVQHEEASAHYIADFLDFQ